MRRTRWSMAQTAILTILLLLLAAPLTVGAADPVPAANIITRLGAPPPVIAPMLAMMGDARTAQTAHFVAKGSITATGDDLTIALNGDVSMQGNLRMRLTLGGSVLAGTPVPPIDIISVNNELYVYVPAEFGIGDTAAWVLIDQNVLNTNMRGSGSEVAQLRDLASLLQQVKVGKIETLADETVNGTLSVHQRVMVDIAGLVGNDKPVPLTVDLWQGKADMQPRRLTINGTYTDSGDTATFAFAMDFTYDDAPVAVTRPATFVKLSTLLG